MSQKALLALTFVEREHLILSVLTTSNSKNNESRRKHRKVIGMVMALPVVSVSQMYT